MGTKLALRASILSALVGVMALLPVGAASAEDLTVDGTGYFTGTGTGLQVTNNASVGGMLSLGGNFAQSGSGTFSTGTGAVSLNGPTSVTGSNGFTVGTGATTLGGNLTVNGYSNFTNTVNFGGYSVNVTGYGGLVVTSQTQLVGPVNVAAMALSNVPFSGPVGSAFLTVDYRPYITINQTTPGQTLTLPNPSNTSAGRLVYVSNVGTVGFTMYGTTLNPNESTAFLWNGMTWSKLK